MSNLDTVRHNWESFGQNDPLWAVASNQDRRKGWNRDEFFATGHAEFAELAICLRLHLPELRYSGTALDFGCGVGRLTQPLAGLFNQVIGVDISQPMLERAQQENTQPNIRWLLNLTDDLQQIPSGSVDFVLCHIVLQHMPNELALGYLAEFARILTTGGGLVFTLPSEPAATPRGRAYRLLPAGLIFRFKRLRDKATMEMHAIHRDQLTDQLAALGFDVYAEPSRSAGPNWRSFRYFCRKAF
jgi:SAM-dependent methyltransferase